MQKGRLLSEYVALPTLLSPLSFFLPFVYAPSSRPLQSHFAFFELSSAFVDHLVEMSVVYTMLPIIVLYYILTHVVLHACISYS